MPDKNPDSFFEEKVIKVVIDGETILFFMRPLKVKEIIETLRISAMEKRLEGDIESKAHLAKLVSKTIDKSIDGLPVECVKEITDAFYDYNSLMDPKPGGQVKDKFRIIKSALALNFDFLISQGHTMSDIMEYTIPQMELFRNAAMERMTGKVQGDLVEIGKDMGIPFKGKEEMA